RSVEEVDRVGVVVNAIEEIVVLGGPVAVCSKCPRCGVAASVRLRSVYASCKLRQERKIATVKRQVVDILRIYDLADRSILRLKYRSGCRDLKCFADGARLECEVRDDALADADRDAVLRVRLEALHGDDDLVGPDAHGRELVPAILAS